MFIVLCMVFEAFKSSFEEREFCLVILSRKLVFEMLGYDLLFILKSVECKR